MKQTILILLILSSIHCFGQKWHLNTVNKSKEYSYEYWFQFENIEDTSSFQLTKIKQKLNSTIELINNQNESLIFATIKILDMENNSEILISSEFNGNKEFQLKNGKYRVEIIAINFDNYYFEIEIDNNEQVELLIKLGLAPDLEVYQINSKARLKDSIIKNIINCVKLDKKNFNKCSIENKYKVLMQYKLANLLITLQLLFN